MQDILIRLSLPIVVALFLAWIPCIFYWWRFLVRLRHVRPSIGVGLPEVMLWGYGTPAGARIRRFVRTQEYVAIGDPDLTRLGDRTRLLTRIFTIVTIVFFAIVLLSWFARQ